MMTPLKSPNMNVTDDPKRDDNLVKIISFDGDGSLQLIHGYDTSGFRITGSRHEGPVILLPRQTMTWKAPSDPELLTATDIVSALGTPAPPLLILGAGEAPQSPLLSLGAALRADGINLEVMSTSAACRTWNVLMSEGRNAAACLYLTKK